MKKIPEELNDYLFEILDQAKNGITITDPNQDDNPVIYVNKTFTDIFGYSYDEIVGRNCRFLQNDDRDQSGSKKIRVALDKQKSVTAVIRNYTKDGVLVYNELAVSPIFDKDTGKLKYFLGVQRDVTP